MGVLGICYKWTSKTSGKSYIGQTTQPIERRKSTGYSAHFQNAIEKYGWEDFEFTELGIYSVDNLNEAERYWIGVFDTFRNGYNSTTGGDGCRGYIQTEKTIRKKSQQVFQFSLSGDFIQAFDSINQAMRETGARHIVECLKNKAHTSGGFLWSDTKTKIKNSKDNYRGTPISIHCFDKQGVELKKYKSISEASKELDIHAGHISECAKGKRKSAGGFVWRYSVGG